MEFRTKENIQSELHVAFSEMKSWLSQQDDDKFNVQIIEGKWTTAGHVYHLVKSTKAVTNGLKFPKQILENQFGTMNRAERTYSELQEKYRTNLKVNSIKAPAEYEAAPDRLFEKNKLIDRLEQEMIELGATLGKWNDQDISKYVLPHPAVGKLSLREMGIFTVLHTYHHLDILKNEYSL